MTHLSSFKVAKGGEFLPLFVIASRRRGNPSGGAFLKIASSLTLLAKTKKAAERHFFLGKLQWRLKIVSRSTLLKGTVNGFPFDDLFILSLRRQLSKHPGFSRALLKLSYLRFNLMQLVGALQAVYIEHPV